MITDYRINDANGQRTLDQFKNNIKERTKRENLFKEIFILQNPNCSIEDNGIDNSGEFVANAYANADWKIIYEKAECLAEVMVHDEKYSTCSFKESKLKRAIKDNNIILILRNNYYLIFDIACCRELLTYPKQVFPGMGYKECVVLNNEDLNKLIENGKIVKKNWNKLALEKIEELKEELFP